jgi:hypothetical protein
VWHAGHGWNWAAAAVLKAWITETLPRTIPSS